MKSRLQKTLAHKVVFFGKGLHSGRLVTLEVHPAEDNFGVVFQRTDSEAAMPVRATARNITSTDLSTSIGNGPSKVSTIEHLMAALAGLEIDNALVQINGPEMPIMDGSSAPFVEQFLKVGFRFGRSSKKVLKVIKAFELRQGDKFIRIEPSDETSFQSTIHFDQKVIGTQSLSYRPSMMEFLKVANARTFCMENDVKMMQENGLALGGSLENAVVVGDDGVLNKEGLRGKDEFVRHKLLDMIGDLYMLGCAVAGKVTAYKSGHGLHAAFTKELAMRMDEYFEVVEFAGSSVEEIAGPAIDMGMPSYVYG